MQTLRKVKYFQDYFDLSKYIFLYIKICIIVK